MVTNAWNPGMPFPTANRYLCNRIINIKSTMETNLTYDMYVPTRVMFGGRDAG